MKLQFRNRKCRDHTPALVSSTISFTPPHTRRELFRCAKCRCYLGARVEFPRELQLVPLNPPPPWPPTAA